jgi:MoaA/NifB/PqqE/SkfB family radical SAM enzyme
MKRLRELIFFVTRRCDLRCRTCFFAADAAVNTGGPELSLPEIDEVASRLRRLDSLYLSGGEPSLREDLADICFAFRRRCRIGSIHLPSNGQDPGRIRSLCLEILRRLPGVRLTLSLSLDGREAAHDRIKDSAGSFRRAVETARSLAPLRREFPQLRLYVITVVSSENRQEVLPLAAWLEESLDLDGHGPSPLRGLPRDPSLADPTAGEWRDLAAALLPFHRRWLRRGGLPRWRQALAANRVRHLYGVYGRVLAGGELPFHCLAGERIAVLDPEGGVRLCEETPVVGDVRRSGYDLAAVLHGPRARQERLRTRSCACTHACFLENSIRSHPLSRARSLLGRAPSIAHG